MIALMARQEQKLFRVGAAAHELGLHPMTVRRWIKAGRIQVIQVGREVRVPRSEIERILGSYEDRLTCFGQEFLETLFSCFGVRLTVLAPGEEKTPEQELTADLLTLIASFSGRLYGMRSHKQKEFIKCAQAVITSP
jgi:excisionase family DNA binding protein